MSLHILVLTVWHLQRSLRCLWLPAAGIIGGVWRNSRKRLVQASCGVVRDEPICPLACAGRVFHVLQDICDFVLPVAEDDIVESWEDVGGAADEIIQAAP